jgi:predicted nucleic acid-binding protein
MNDKFFIDTNIFIYSFDYRDADKMNCALAIINDANITGKGIISWQVIQEFLNAASRKFAKTFTTNDMTKYLRKILNPLCQIYPDMNLYQDALEIMDSTHYHFYDSLILASAVRGECTILYSEDFQEGQVIKGVKVVNPFSDQQ